MKKIYLDHAATTAVRPEVMGVMLPYFQSMYGNPSSSHEAGKEAKDAVAEARKTVADILNTTPRSIIFTGSGTESINLALQGVVRAVRLKQPLKRHCVTSAIEHKAVLGTLKFLSLYDGVATTIVTPEKDGRITAATIEQSIRPETILVSVMYANNEIGTISPIKEIAAITKKYGVFLHVDACQAGWALPLDVEELGVDLLTLNGSKIYGPKGVGVLFVREGVPLVPIVHGGGQEFGLRSGTENVPLIIGFAKALELAQQERMQEVLRQTVLRDRMIEAFLQIQNVKLNGHRYDRLPSNVHCSFLGLEAETLLEILNQKGIYASAGSACHSNTQNEESHVLKAIGLSQAEIHGSLRFTLGTKTSEEDIQKVIATVTEAVQKIKTVPSKGG